MCIIIDTNTLSHVFNKNDEKHPEFKPILDWILNGQGKVVFGGTKYLHEISPKIVPILNTLRAVNKAVKVDDNLVDAEAIKVSAMIQHADFDDQHIVGLLLMSGCKLISSLDARAYPYFQHNLFFSAKKRPKIYTGERNSDLLCNHNIADICMPCVSLNQKVRALLGLD